MATITKSIGTSSRDYSTITAWEADLDNTGIYTSGDDAVGECYNDAAFDESVGIDGGSTVGLNSIKLTAANGEKHDGTEGTGVRIVSSTQIIFIGTNGSVDKTISFIEVDRTAAANANFTMISLTASAGSGATNNLNACIVHGAAVSTQNYRSLKGIATGSVAGITYNITNNIVYDITHASGGNPTGITTSTGNIYIYNCTVHDITEPGGTTGSCFSVTCNDLRNCIATDCSGNDFATGTISGTESNNLSSDSTASGTGSLTGKTAANQFVSTVAGSEDLHLLSTADAVGAGVDLATTSVDINGSDRNALAATIWDIGAHQYASTASIGTSSRDYSTITLWEADLDDTTIYGAGANAVGECYNDAAFVERISLNGGTTVGLNTTTLTVAAGEMHDGTAGTGARVETPSNWGAILYFGNDSIPTRVEWLEFENLHATANGMIYGAAYDYYKSLSKLLVHSTTNHPPGYIAMGFWAYSVDNCIVYSQGTSTGGGISIASYYTGGDIVNNTVYLARTGISAQDNPTSKVFAKNNIAIARDSNYQGFNVTTATTYPNWDSNITNGSVLYGTNTHTGITASQLFVSVVSGSEDLHLKSDAYAVGLGANLSSVSPSPSQNTVISSGYASKDIDNQDRSTFTGTTWDIGADQVKTPASIGTSSRDYSTTALWEADLDDSTLYSSTDEAVGEMYNDSVFTASVFIGLTPAAVSSATLTVPESERHDGTAGTGARASKGSSLTSRDYYKPISLEWLEIYNDTITTDAKAGVSVFYNTGSIRLINLIVHDVNTTRYGTSNSTGIYTNSNITNVDILNSLVYNIYNDINSTGATYGVTSAGNTSQYYRLLNNTIYNVTTIGTGDGIGVTVPDQANDSIRNNIVVGCTTKDFNTSSYANVTASNNISSDGTASGTGSKTNQPASRQFVSTLSGSEDLHLIFKSAAIDAGVDLGTTPDGVQYDIDGKDRDTENSIWDIGAHEYGDNVIFGLLRV